MGVSKWKPGSKQPLTGFSGHVATKNPENQAFFCGFRFTSERLLLMIVMTEDIKTFQAICV